MDSPTCSAMQVLPYPVLVAVGMALTLSTALSTRLAVYFGTVIYVSFQSFVLGLTLLSLVVLYKRVRKRIAGTLKDEPPFCLLPNARAGRPWWLYTGGVLGACYVVGITYSAVYVGLALTFVSSISGNLIAAAVIDHIGFLGTPVRAITPVRSCALLVVLGGCILSICEDFQAGDTTLAVGFVLVSLACGAILPLQACLNRRITALATAKHLLHTTWVSFFMGMVTSGIASLVLSLLWLYVYDRPDMWDFQSTSWWMYANGVIGVLYVYLSVGLAPVVGMTRMFMLVVLGQLVSSLVFDNYGLIGIRQKDATPLRVSGTAVVLLGTIIYSLQQGKQPAKVRPAPLVTVQPLVDLPGRDLGPPSPLALLSATRV
eukprot:m.29131 g.29131  ORF g.29131 m.29131 type:complete len:373 (-) comp4632_c0_seq1:65-1183(-)